MSFGCEHICSSPWRVSNFNSNVLEGGIYLSFERDPLNIFRVKSVNVGRVYGRRGDDAKTIISPDTSFGDIITCQI